MTTLQDRQLLRRGAIEDRSQDYALNALTALAEVGFGSLSHPKRAAAAGPSRNELFAFI